MPDYIRFVKAIHSKTGIDLSLYKEAQMRRRLQSLYEKKGYRSFDSFYEALARDPKLMDEFLDRMTINVSEFYRNAKRWQVLQEKILPALLRGGTPLNAWSAACSTGEEPYSLAIVLSHLQPLSRISIFATDIDDNALAKARAGLYAERALAEVPASARARFFAREGELFRISDDIRRCVSFQKHNLLRDAYRQQLDLIVCRNVMIYFTEEAKDQIYRRFSAALRPGGVLFVGSTEQIFNPARYGLEVADTFFYRKL